ncbi:MAG: tetratricopeptide repeat-containing sensor histidine kinase, partial [Sphingobacteriaceae bacterium]
MKYLLSLLFFLTISLCRGQDIDSLKKVVSGTNTKASGLLLKDIGTAYKHRRMFDSALVYYDKAAEVLIQIKKQDTLADSYAALARGYAGLKNYDKAIICYNKFLVYAPQTGERRQLMAALKQLGLLYEIKKNYREALSYFRQYFDINDSLEFVKKIQDNTPEAYSHNFMANVMGNINEKAETVEDILKTIETKRALNDTLALTINYFNLGVLYKIKQMYTPALDALQQCLWYATKIHYTDMRISAVTEITDLYEQTGDHKKSLAYLKKRIALNALRNTGTAASIGELQTKYEIIQREDRLLQQQFEITKRNYWMTGIAVIIVLMLAIGFIYYKQTRLKQRNIAMQAIITTEESERRRIAQDLHDSVSQTMSAAKMNLTVIADELPFANNEQRARFQRAISMVDDGFREVRTISHNMAPWALHETGLAKVVTQFLGNIEQKTISINFFSKGFDEHFDDTIEIILYRVLQESVNNVMKHAQASRLDISLMRDEQAISLTIEDNGKGFD